MTQEEIKRLLPFMWGITTDHTSILMHWTVKYNHGEEFNVLHSVIDTEEESIHNQ